MAGMHWQQGCCKLQAGAAALRARRAKQASEGARPMRAAAPTRSAELRASAASPNFCSSSACEPCMSPRRLAISASAAACCCSCTAAAAAARCCASISCSMRL